MKRFGSLNEAFVESLKDLKENHSLVNSRGSLQREILWYSMEITDPTALSIEVPARNFKPDYAITEWLWYLSGIPWAGNIGKLAGIWQKIADGRGTVESNYGRYLHDIPIDNNHRFTQWEWAANELITDRDSRRATLTINSVHHKVANPKDYPCTQYLHFFIRDNKLHLGVKMRSNDAVFGFCNDVFTFCMYQQLMLNDLNHIISELNINKWNDYIEPVQLGSYFHSADSFHVYETHFRMMDRIVDNYGKRYDILTDQKRYPNLKKFELKANITLGYTYENHETLRLPHHDMSCDEIQDFTTIAKEELYV